MPAPIGAHASALMALRAKSLQAYGLTPQDLIVEEERALVEIPKSHTRALAKSKREERALAVQSEHALMNI